MHLHTHFSRVVGFGEGYELARGAPWAGASNKTAGVPRMRQRPDPLYYFRTLRFSREARYARQEKTALWSAYPARDRLPVQGHGEWPVPIARGIEHGTEDAARQDEGLPESQAVQGSPLPRGV
jgi:hypothetical protein